MFNSADWLAVLANTYPLSFQTWPDSPGRGIPYCHCDDLPGRLLITLPFTDYLLFEGCRDEILSRMEQIGRANPGYAMILRLGGNHALDNLPAGWKVARQALYHRVAIGERQEMEQRMSAMFRRNLKTAQKKQLTVRISGDREALQRFYGLFAEQRRAKFKILSPPLRLFESLYEIYFTSGRGLVFEAWQEGCLLSALVILMHDDGVYYKHNASIPESSRFCPNNLLLWEVARFCFERGYRYLDLGLSILDGNNDGLIQFKEGLGGVATPVVNLRYEPEGYPAGQEEKNRELFRHVTRFMVELDLDSRQLDAAGKLLFHYFI